MKLRNYTMLDESMRRLAVTQGELTYQTAGIHAMLNALPSPEYLEVVSQIVRLTKQPNITKREFQAKMSDIYQERLNSPYRIEQYQEGIHRATYLGHKGLGV